MKETNDIRSQVGGGVKSIGGAVKWHHKGPFPKAIHGLEKNSLMSSGKMELSPHLGERKEWECIIC